MSWGLRDWVLAAITDEVKISRYLPLVCPISLTAMYTQAGILYQLSFSLCSFPYGKVATTFAFSDCSYLFTRLSLPSKSEQPNCCVHSLFITQSPNYMSGVCLAQPEWGHLQCRRPGVDPWVWEIRDESATTPRESCLGNPSWTEGTSLALNASRVTKSWTQLSDKNHTTTPNYCPSPVPAFVWNLWKQ